MKKDELNSRTEELERTATYYRLSECVTCTHRFSVSSCELTEHRKASKNTLGFRRARQTPAYECCHSSDRGTCALSDITKWYVLEEFWQIWQLWITAKRRSYKHSAEFQHLHKSLGLCISCGQAVLMSVLDYILKLRLSELVAFVKHSLHMHFFQFQDSSSYSVKSGTTLITGPVTPMPRKVKFCLKSQVNYELINFIHVQFNKWYAFWLFISSSAFKCNFMYSCTQFPPFLSHFQLQVKCSRSLFCIFGQMNNFLIYLFYPFQSCRTG